MKIKITVLALILLMVLWSCKKKNDEDPAPVQPTCATMSPKFAGRYWIGTNNDTLKTDTVFITFQSNNCPTENSNLYKFKNFNKALNNYMNFVSLSSYTLANFADFTMAGDERLEKIEEGNILIGINPVTVPQWHLSLSYWKPNSTPRTFLFTTCRFFKIP